MVESQEALERTLSKQLLAAIESLPIRLADRDVRVLILYLLELAKWNRTYNLTAVKDIQAMLTQHILDCLAIVPALQRYEKQSNSAFQTIIDVGSGAGLPAVVLAVCYPESKVISVDAVEKKMTFVAHVASRLGLVNLSAQHARVESVDSEQADLVISRAFSSLAQFVQKAQHLVRGGGAMAAMKSRQLEQEQVEFAASSSGWRIDQVDSIEVPSLKATRYLAWLKREAENE